VQDYEEISGHGIRARVNGRTVLAGNDRLLHREAIPHDVCVVDGTVAHLAVDGQYSGHILIADELKDDAVATVRDLRKQGIKTAMLTGDNQAVAEPHCRPNWGLTSTGLNCCPKTRSAALEELLHQTHQSHGKVAFVGDGINDAPVIARADVGMAMGGLGSDAAIETADVVIMTDAPSKVGRGHPDCPPHSPHCVAEHSGWRWVLRWALSPWGLWVMATLWAAVFADVGVALLAILNASRIYHGR
jgi:Cd2+/Zn2+-exporting ATPase